MTEYSLILDKVFKINQVTFTNEIQNIENAFLQQKQEELLFFNTKAQRNNKQQNDSKNNLNEESLNSHRDSARNKNVITEKVSKIQFMNYAAKKKYEV